MSDRQDALHSSRRLAPLSIVNNSTDLSAYQHDHIAPLEVRADEIVQAFEGWHHGYLAPQHAHTPAFPEPLAPSMRPSHSPSIQQSAYPTGSPASTTPSASTSVASPTTSHPLLRSFTSHGLDTTADMHASHLFHTGPDDLLAQLAYPSLSRQGSSGLNWNAEMPYAMMIDSGPANPRLDVMDGLPPRTVSPGLGESNSGLPPFGASRTFPDAAHTLDQDVPKMRLQKAWQSYTENATKKASHGFTEASGWGQEPLELAMNRNSGQGFTDAGLGLGNNTGLSLHVERRTQLLGQSQLSQRKSAPSWNPPALGGSSRMAAGGIGAADHVAQFNLSGSCRSAQAMGVGELAGMPEDIEWSEPSNAMVSRRLQLRHRSLSRPHSSLLPPPHAPLDIAANLGTDPRAFTLPSPNAHMSLPHLDHEMRMLPDPSIDPQYVQQALAADDPMDTQHIRSRSYTVGMHSQSYNPFSLAPPSSPSSLMDGSSGRRSSTSSPNVPPGLEYNVEKVKPVAPPPSPTPSSSTSSRPRRKYKVPMVPVPQLVLKPELKLANPSSRPSSSTSMDLPPLYPSHGQSVSPQLAAASLNTSSQGLGSPHPSSISTAPPPPLFTSHSSQPFPTLGHARFTSQASMHNAPAIPSSNYFANQQSQSMSTTPFHHQSAAPQTTTMQRMRSGPVPDTIPSTTQPSSLHRSMSESYGTKLQAPSLYHTMSTGIGGSRPILTLPRAQNVSIVPWGELGPGTRSDIEHRLGLSGTGAGMRGVSQGGGGPQHRWQAMHSQEQLERDVEMQGDVQMQEQMQMQQHMRMQQRQQDDEIGGQQQRRSRLQLVRPQLQERVLVKREDSAGIG